MRINIIVSIEKILTLLLTSVILFDFYKIMGAERKENFLIFQLCRELWDVMLRPPVSTIGRIMETPMLKLNCNDTTITESKSVKDELVQVGFKRKRVHIVPIGLDFQPWSEKSFLDKEVVPTFIYVGRCVKSKGIDKILEAFGEFKKKYPKAKLWIVGNVKSDMWPIMKPLLTKYRLEYGKDEGMDVVFWGYVDEEKKEGTSKPGECLIVPISKRRVGNDCN